MENRHETSSSRRYPSSQQKVVLVELLEADPELRSGKFSDSLTRKVAQDRWENISATLNKLKGAIRSPGEWRKTWQDMKSHAKRRDIKTSKITRQTCNGLISDKEEMILPLFPENGHNGSNILRPEVVFIDEGSVDMSTSINCSEIIQESDTEDIKEKSSWKRQCLERGIETMDRLQQTLQESNDIMRETLEIKKEKLKLYKRHLELKEKFYSDQSLSISKTMTTRKPTIKKEV